MLGHCAGRILGTNNDFDYGAEATFLLLDLVGIFACGDQFFGIYIVLTCNILLMLYIISACISIRSESPSQVFLIVIHWLFETLKSVPVDRWPSVVLAYDNMCHLDSLKAARQPLPLPPPFDEMWLKITKVS